MLLPAIGGVIRKAKIAKIGVEISLIEQALEKYKLEFGEFPPDFTTYAEGGDFPSRRVQLDNEFQTHMARNFRRRIHNSDAPVMVDLETGDTAQVTEPHLIENLDPSEALPFWLGGFSNDPQAPISGSGGRQPFFEFDKTRLMDQDGDGFLEYYPAGSTAPYVYYRAQINNSEDLAYERAFSFISTTDRNHDGGSGQWSEAVTAFSNVYPIPYFADRVAPGSGANAAAAPRTFQIISASLDGKFGPGNRVITDRVANLDEEDDLTNFSQGKTMKDLVQD